MLLYRVYTYSLHSDSLFWLTTFIARILEDKVGYTTTVLQ